MVRPARSRTMPWVVTRSRVWPTSGASRSATRRMLSPSGIGVRGRAVVVVLGVVVLGGLGRRDRRGLDDLAAHDEPAIIDAGSRREQPAAPRRGPGGLAIDGLDQELATARL